MVDKCKAILRIASNNQIIVFDSTQEKGSKRTKRNDSK